MTDEFAAYLEMRIEEEVRARGGRWFYDCRVCGKPLKTHGEKCVFDADQCQPRGIVT